MSMGGRTQKKTRRRTIGVSEMNFISNLSCGELFLIIIGGFVVLVMLEWFRRQAMIMPWTIAAVGMIGGILGSFVVVYGFREIQSGGWTGVIWVMIGAGVAYMANRKRFDYLKQKKAEKDE